MPLGLAKKVCSLVVISAAALGGCQSTEPVASRSVTTSLVGPGGAVNQLDFLDKLEGKAITTWDEMLAGILLAANKRVGGDYSARLGQARSFGLVGPDAPLNGDTPATPAAFSRALLRARGERFDPRTPSDDLVGIAQKRGLLPSSLRANDILSGSVVVGALVAVGEPTAKPQVPARASTPADRTAAVRGVSPAAPSPRPAPAPVPAPPAATSAAAAFEAFEDPAPVAAPSSKAPSAPGPIKTNDPSTPSVRPEPVPELPRR